MKKIAMLTCLNAANSVCTGSGCMRAFNRRTDSFEQYGSEDLELIAFFHCNGCERDCLDDPKLQEKLQRIVEIRPDALHLGVCTVKSGGVRCEVIKKYVDFFLEHGICVINGTHGSTVVENIGARVDSSNNR